MPNTNSKAWIGVDLDGTLSTHMFMKEWDGSIGEPIPSMINRVKKWLEEGIRVKIVTARVAPYFNDDNRNVEVQRRLVNLWLIKHIGQELEVVAHKDFGMIELWDDRAIRIITNTGRRCCTIEDQPSPIPKETIPVWDLVIEDMKQRDKVGRERYGTPLQTFNGRDALIDAYQEALDLVVYLRQAIEEREILNVKRD